MKLRNLVHESPFGRILSAVFAILFALCVGPAYSASEPGTVTIVLMAEPQNMDPGEWWQDLTSHVLYKNVLEPLMEMNPEDSSISPALATSWKRIDATTWQVSLRKGVKFHDGADFNAEAVIFNIKRLYDKKIASRTRGKFFAGFKMEGRALDSHTLEIKLDKPESLLPTFLGFLPICSPNTPLELTRKPIGTGPYKFVKWDAGSQIILERFDGYWRKQPQVKKAVYVWRGESSVRASMVDVGEADLAPTIAVQDATRPDMDYSYFNSATTGLRIGGEWVPPLNDRRVRMALSYAVDRNALRGSILSKHVVPASQFILPSIFGYNQDLKPWSYNPQLAKKLLDEARRDGVPVDKEILLLARSQNYPGSEELMEAVMTMYKAVGLNVKLKIMEQLVLRPYRYKPYPTNGEPYLVQILHDNNFGDAVFTGFMNFHCKGEASSMCDKAVDDLIEKAQGAMGTERRTLWQSAFKRIHEEIVPTVMLFHLVGYSRVGKRINFKPSIATVIEIPLAQITFTQ